MEDIQRRCKMVVFPSGFFFRKLTTTATAAQATATQPTAKTGDKRLKGTNLVKPHSNTIINEFLTRVCRTNEKGNTVKPGNRHTDRINDKGARNL